jgi:signal peptidase I
MKIDIVHTNLVGNLYDIVPANKVKPSWWTKMPFNVPGTDHEVKLEGKPTVKACPAVHGLFNMGYVLLSPCDFEIKSNETDFRFKLPDGIQETDHELNTYVQYGHVPPQFQGFEGMAKDYVDYTFKLDTQTHLMADEPCNFILIDPFWNGFARPIRPLEANLQISNDLYPSNIGHALIPNFLIKKNSHFMVRKGEPLLQIIPIPHQAVEANVYRLIERGDTYKFKDYEEIFYTKEHYVQHPSNRGWLKNLVFSNRYSFQERDAKDFMKRFKKKWWNRWIKRSN